MSSEQTQRTYTCAHCGGVFAYADEDPERSDEHARAEFVANFGREPHVGEPGDDDDDESLDAIVCEDCYNFMVGIIPPNPSFA
jgi:DNA-directed RNA polymerase subunit RPC12/RpoP